MRHGPWWSTKFARLVVNCFSLPQPLIEVECEHGTLESPLDFAQHCATEKEIRDASVEATKKLSDFGVEISMRKDIFDRISALQNHPGFEALSPEQKRFVKKEITNGRRNGLHLSEEQRSEITKIKKKISELGTDYSSNMNEDTSFLEFTEQELIGVPHDLVNSFEKVCCILIPT